MNTTTSQFVLSYAGQEQVVQTLEQLRRHWLAAFRQGSVEIWLVSSTGSALSVLVNRDRAFLMFLREAGDAGFTSRDPAYTGPPEAMLEFRLSNGQVDEYPASWTVSIEEARLAGEHFFLRGDKAPSLTWHDDG